MEALGTSADAVLGEFASATDWAFLTRGAYSPRIPTCCRVVDWSRVRDVAMPTDDKGSLLGLNRLRAEQPSVARQPRSFSSDGRGGERGRPCRGA